MPAQTDTRTHTHTHTRARIHAHTHTWTRTYTPSGAHRNMPSYPPQRFTLRPDGELYLIVERIVRKSRIEIDESRSTTWPRPLPDFDPLCDCALYHVRFATI